MLGNKTIFHNNISIHALREESDAYAATSPTLAAGISIHALREESDFRPSPTRTS